MFVAILVSVALACSNALPYIHQIALANSLIVGRDDY